MITLKGNIRRAATVVLAAAVLAIGALACGLQNDDEVIAELETKLSRVEQLTTGNAIQVGVNEASIGELEKKNEQLTGRVAQLEQEKKDLMDLVAQISGAAGGAAVAGMTPGVMDDAAALQRFIECTVKAANPGANATVLAMASGFAETSLTEQLEAGTMTYEDIRQQIPLVCAGQ